MKFNINALILDLDNTLIQWSPSPKMILKALMSPKLLLRRANIQQQQERCRGVRHDPASEFSTDGKPAEIDGYFVDSAAISKSLMHWVNICDQRGIKRAVVSDNSALNKLAVLHLQHGWSSIVSCRALGCLKPFPDGIQAACSQMGVLTQETLVIGDRLETDGKAAFNAGAKFLLYSDLHLLSDLQKYNT